MSTLNTEAEEIIRHKLVKQKASAPGEIVTGLKHLAEVGGGIGLA